MIHRNVIQYNQSHSDFPLPSDQLDRYIPKVLVYSLLWSFAGDAKLKVRSDLGDFIRSVTTIPLPPQNSNMPIIDYEVSFAILRLRIYHQLNYQTYFYLQQIFTPTKLNPICIYLFSILYAFVLVITKSQIMYPIYIPIPTFTLRVPVLTRPTSRNSGF